MGVAFSILTIFNRVYVIICSTFVHQLKTIQHEKSIYYPSLRYRSNYHFRNPFLLPRVKRLPR